MTSVINPYTPGEIPRVLAGRQIQTARARQALVRVTSFGEMGGPLLVFQGPRGVGKTSLLRDVERESVEAGLIPAWVACIREEPFLADVVNRVDHAISDADAVQTSGKKAWRSTLESFGLEVGLPVGVRVSTRFRREPTPAAPLGVPELQDVLHHAATLIRESGGSGLALFLDELHAGAPGDLAVLLNALQNLNGARSDNPIAVFGAGLPSIAATLTRAATFGERTTFVDLPRLTFDAAAEAVVGPAAALDVRWEADALRVLLGECDGFPYLLQVYAHAVWDVAEPVAGGVVTSAAIERGLVTARDHLSALYEARWTAATDLEQRIMTAMAVIGTDLVRRTEIAAALDRPSRALSVPRDRLIAKGIVEPGGRGTLRFTLPGFDRFVLERVDDR